LNPKRIFCINPICFDNFEELKIGKMKTWKNQIIVAMFLFAAIVSCKKDDTPPVPKLTPSGSFSMEFSDFDNGKSAYLLKENWLYSSLNVSVFSIFATSNMVIPSLAFNESFNHKPTYIGDMTWQWSYDFPALGTTYSARLNGIVQKDEKVKWDMYIDQAGTSSFTNFLWFEGTTTDSTAANWIIYENPASPAPALNINWTSNPSYSETILRFTNVSSKAENQNSYIEYGKSPTASFDRFYNIYLKNENATINIEWNSNTKNGRVKSLGYYEDESWHCWNEKLQDAWCD
jgi:hypothetical protein